MWRKNDDDKATQRLLEVMIKYRVGRKVGREMTNYCGMDCDEVYRGILIGDEYSARNKLFLKSVGVTHVLNAAEGTLFGMVNTDEDFYKGTGIAYQGFHIIDLPVVDITKHFEEAVDFIDDALRSGGKVLVHCKMGLSRSATLVLAFLMLRRNMRACEAIAMVRQRRNINPNIGFLKCLASLDNKIERRRRLMLRY